MDNDSGDDGTDELRQFVEKSEKKNDQDQVDRMQEVYSKGKEMHNEMSGQ